MNLKFLNDIELLIWDWNGTILNDVDCSVHCINKVLQNYGYQEITIKEYRKLFTFPIKEYYKNIGFDFKKHPFEKVGKDFIDLYNKDMKRTNLQPNALKVLKFFKEKNKKQIVISAREHNSLLSDLEYFKLSDYFDEIHGISNIYAESKINLFKNYLEKNKISPNKILLIGDTTHDFDIANELGFKFIQLATGHQDASHFDQNKIISINNLIELIH